MSNNLSKQVLDDIFKELKDVAVTAGLSDVYVNAWQNQTKEGGAITLCQVKGKAILRKKDIIQILSGIDFVKIPPPDTINQKFGTGIMAIPGIMDAHFGKLAISGDYDAREVYIDVAQRMYNTMAQMRPEKIVFPVGSDLIHFDNASQQTTLGTQMDVEGNRFNITKDVVTAVVSTINLFSTIAPVEVVMLRGNHDDHSITILGAAISAMFSNHELVTVNDDPGYRKYTSWGECLIGFTHGDKGRLDRIAASMPIDVPDLWGASKYREFLCGHFHRRQRNITLGDESHGVYVNYMPSLAPVDYWHNDNAFVGSFQGAELKFYNKFNNIATFTYNS